MSSLDISKLPFLGFYCAIQVVTDASTRISLLTSLIIDLIGLSFTLFSTLKSAKSHHCISNLLYQKGISTMKSDPISHRIKTTTLFRVICKSPRKHQFLTVKDAHILLLLGDFFHAFRSIFSILGWRVFCNNLF